MVDLTHGVPPQAVRVGALLLREALPYFPPDTVFLAVVDPGVGSERRPVCARSADRLFVGPDNGLLWPGATTAGEPAFFHLDRPEFWLPAPGATFQGRDLFAPVAAALASGVQPEQCGTPVYDPVRLTIPEPRRTERGWAGEVLLIDRYGNAVTNFRPEHLPRPWETRFTAAGKELGRPVTHYAAVAPGEVAVLRGSMGYFEVAANGGSAAKALTLRPGDPIHACDGADDSQN